METTQLLAEVNRHYAISGRVIKPYGPIWRIESPSGAYALKSMRRSADQLLRLATVLTDLTASGFCELEPFLITVEGSPFLEYSNRRFILGSWLEGSHPSFTAPTDLLEVGALFARLHQAARTVGPLADWPLSHALELFNRRLAFLETLPSSDNSNRIDRAICHWQPYFWEQARISCIALESLGFSEWLLHTEQKGFCHNDPAPRNIIIANGKWRLIDFELSSFACFIAEYATLLTRALAVLNWNEAAVGTAERLLETYDRIRPLTKMEIRILPYLCYFPQRFWRLCSQRFEEHLGWTERHFAGKLWEITTVEPKRRILLQRLFPELRTVM